MEVVSGRDPAEDELPPLVGRTAELEELIHGLTDARAGRGSMFQVVGEPGIGKTALVRTLSDVAARQGATVLWGRCWEGGGAPAYWPWVQVVRATLATDQQRSTARSRPPGVLAQIIPELATPAAELAGPAPPVQPDEARFALFDAVARLLRASTSDVLVVVVEDLHAADAPSVVLLRFLAAELQDARVLFVSTFRDVGSEIEPATAQALAELCHEGRRLHLVGLRPEDVGRLVAAATGGPPGADIVARLHRTSGGNPFFLAQLLREGVGRLTSVQSASTVPDTCRAAIRRRIALLPGGCARLLAHGAVIGPAPTVAALEAVCDLPLDTVLDLLAEAVSAGLLVETEPARRYSFVHALVREVLYDDLAPSERLRLHRRVGEALETLYSVNADAFLAELAHHFVAAAPGGTVHKGIDYTIRAGQRALAQLAYEEAAAQFARASSLVEAFEPEDLERRCDVLLALSDAQWRCGQLTNARATADRAAGIARQLASPQRLARAALGRTVGENMSFTDASVIALLKEALAALGPGDSTLRALVLSRLAVALCPVPGVPGPGRALGEEAVAVARRLDDPPTLARAITARLHACWEEATPDEMLVTATEMLALAEPRGDADMVLQAHMWRLIALLELGDLSGCSAALAAYERVARRVGQPLWLFYATSRQATVAMVEGRFADAEHLVEEARAAASRAEEGQDARRVVTFQRMFLDAIRARPDELERALPSVRGWAQSVAVSSLVSPAALLAWLLWATGREAEARAEVERIFGHSAAELPTWRLDVVFAVCLVADVLVAVPGCRVPEEVLREFYDLLRPHAGRMAVGAGAVLCLGLVERSLGQLAAAMGRIDDAATHFEVALERHRRLGALPWLASTQRDLARLLLRNTPRQGDDRAAALIADARGIATELGMTSLLVDLDALAAAGSQPSPADTAGVAEFRREGDYWVLRHGTHVARLRHARGLAHLHQLLTHPGREFHVLDLVALTHGDASPRPHLSGNAGELLDARARIAYRRRLEDLADELDEAESFGDLERAAQARAESEALIDQLAAAVGLGGRDRVAASETERARSAVTKAIKSALGRVAEVDPALGRHLRATVRTGTFCSYRPEAPVAFR